MIKITRKPVFTKKRGDALYSDEGEFLGYGHFESDVEFKKGKQLYYILSYGNIVGSFSSYNKAKTEAKKYATLRGDNVSILKFEGEYIPKW